MRILIVGGTGLISSALTNAAEDHDVTLVNRGITAAAPQAHGAHIIHADATDAVALRSALRGPRLRGEKFDAVVQFVAYHPQQVREDLETFARLTDQYVLIATSAAYRKTDVLAPLTEATPLENPYWRYAREKIACEEVLREASGSLAWTIVRPAHTYGPSKIPAFTGNSRHPWTIVDRMRRGRDIVLPGDGTSLWTLTHAHDVATGILGLLGNEAAIGRAVHITSNEALTWLGIYARIADAAGISRDTLDRLLVCVPSDALVAASPDQEGSIRGDKMHHAVYDTSLITSLVPDWQAQTTFAEGVRECIAWFEADSSRQVVDDAANAMFDRVARIYRDALIDAARAT